MKKGSILRVVGAYLVCAMSLAGCHSPLLEHANAEASELRDGGSNGEAVTCPLAFPKHGLCASVEWLVTPNDQDPASFTLRFWSADEGTVSGPYANPGLSVGVKLWMPDMGHGSAPVTVESARDSDGHVLPGIYNGSGASFIMPGDWEVRVQLKNGTALSEEAILEVHI